MAHDNAILMHKRAVKVRQFLCTVSSYRT